MRTTCPRCRHAFEAQETVVQPTLWSEAREPRLLPLGGEHRGAYGHNSPATSRDAAHSIETGSNELRIRNFVAARGDYGATCQEVEIALGLEHTTASARINALKATRVAKWLVRRGVQLDDPLIPWVRAEGTRKTRSGRDENVYVLTPEARGWLNS